MLLSYYIWAISRTSTALIITSWISSLLMGLLLISWATAGSRLHLSHLANLNCLDNHLMNISTHGSSGHLLSHSGFSATSEPSRKPLLRWSSPHEYHHSWVFCSSPEPQRVLGYIWAISRTSTALIITSWISSLLMGLLLISWATAGSRLHLSHLANLNWVNRVCHIVG